MKKLFTVLALSVIISGCGLLDFGAGVKEKAWIYKNLETGTFLYCDADQGNPRDYAFQGTGMFDPIKVERCSLAQVGQ